MNLHTHSPRGREPSSSKLSTNTQNCSVTVRNMSSHRHPNTEQFPFDNRCQQQYNELTMAEEFNFLKAIHHIRSLMQNEIGSNFQQAFETELKAEIRRTHIIEGHGSNATESARRRGKTPPLRSAQQLKASLCYHLWQRQCKQSLTFQHISMSLLHSRFVIYRLLIPRCSRTPKLGTVSVA